MAVFSEDFDGGSPGAIVTTANTNFGYVDEGPFYDPLFTMTAHDGPFAVTGGPEGGGLMSHPGVSEPIVAELVTGSFWWRVDAGALGTAGAPVTTTEIVTFNHGTAGGDRIDDVSANYIKAVIEEDYLALTYEDGSVTSYPLTGWSAGDWVFVEWSFDSGEFHFVASDGGATTYLDQTISGVGEFASFDIWPVADTYLDTISVVQGASLDDPLEALSGEFTDAYDPDWDDDPAWDRTVQLNAILDDDPETCVELNTAEHVKLWLPIDPDIFPGVDTTSINFTVGYNVISPEDPPTVLRIMVSDTAEDWYWRIDAEVTGEGTLNYTIDDSTVEDWPPLQYFGDSAANPPFRDFANAIKADGVLSIFHYDPSPGAVCITGATMTVSERVWRNLAINPSGEQDYNRAWVASNGVVATAVTWEV